MKRDSRLRLVSGFVEGYDVTSQSSRLIAYFTKWWWVGGDDDNLGVTSLQYWLGENHVPRDTRTAA